MNRRPQRHSQDMAIASSPMLSCIVKFLRCFGATLPGSRRQGSSKVQPQGKKILYMLYYVVCCLGSKTSASWPMEIAAVLICAADVDT